MILSNWTRVYHQLKNIGHYKLFKSIFTHMLCIMLNKHVDLPTRAEGSVIIIFTICTNKASANKEFC